MYRGNTNSNKDSTDEQENKKRKLLPSAQKQSDYVKPKLAPKQLKEQVSRKNAESGDHPECQQQQPNTGTV